MGHALASYRFWLTLSTGIIDTPLMQAASPKVKEGLLAQVAAPKR